MNKAYDFIFTGGGAAGLSLAYRLALSSLGDASILIVDKALSERVDQAWSYWTDQPTLFDVIVEREWRRLRVNSTGEARELELGEYRYQMLRSEAFHQFVKRELAAHPNVEFLEGTVSEVVDGAEAARVTVDGQVYTGQWVFNSIFDARRFRPDPGCRFLEQRFLGWEIETGKDSFNPEEATFFDFRTAQTGGLCFFYVLPFSERRALVEGVFHTPGWANFLPAMRAYIHQVLKVDDYRILTKEGGVTLLTDHPFPRRLGQRVMAIGKPGGRVKPTSGYAFSRIQRDSEAILRSLLRHGHPFAVADSAPIYRFCDTLLLQMMARHRETIIPTFMKMFRRNPAPRVLRFLDEGASPWEIIRLMASMAQPVMLPALLETRTPDRTLASARPIFEESGREVR